ncbi:NYN domain-containing protein [Paenirhodobacter enshiensis]|uniref:NYN domain-containing protein n=1 Tax=Paenirhodobacter enshiensis TaxID=1105367 RepID=UPI00068EF57E|nr:NYN domain-containing protein [Paenirhodobacter enshiensis]
MMSESVPAPSFALLIDGDHVSPDDFPKIMEVARTAGELPVMRVHADTARVPGWRMVPGLRCVDSGGGKNTTDIALTVDALDLVLRGGAAGIVLVSRDQDYAPLALYLRERRIPLLCIAPGEVPARLRAAAWKSVALPTAPTQPTPAPPKPQEAAAPTPSPKQQPKPAKADSVEAVLALVLTKPGATIALNAINAEARRRAPDFRISEYGRWPTCIKQLPDRYAIEGAGQGAKVRRL